MAWIQSYDCSTTAGDHSDDLWRALEAGRDLSEPWPEDPTVRAFLFKNRSSGSVQELLVDKLLTAFRPVKPALLMGESLGVILASTKGMSNDFIWQSEGLGLITDPLTPLLAQFLRRSELGPKRSLCVSNACSSSLAAMALAELWLEQGLSQVLILAADAVTPFVVKGFQALKLITPTQMKPFAEGRSGFFLGEGAACLLLSKERRNSEMRLHKVGLDSEGSAVTRPSSSGKSLRQAALNIPHLLELKPQVLIAHGTGTLINDETEDLAFSDLFTADPPITTCTKWCVGHTLAVSGAIDTIAALEALRRQSLFKLKTTSSVDPKFKGRYLTAQKNDYPENFSRVMISSLGFGGMHASALIERIPL